MSKEATRAVSDVVGNLAKRSIREGPGNMAGLDSTHRKVGPVVCVVFDCTLHGNATVEHGIRGAKMDTTSEIYARE